MPRKPSNWACDHIKTFKRHGINIIGHFVRLFSHAFILKHVTVHWNNLISVASLSTTETSGPCNRPKVTLNTTTSDYSLFCQHTYSSTLFVFFLLLLLFLYVFAMELETELLFMLRLKLCGCWKNCYNNTVNDYSIPSPSLLPASIKKEKVKEKESRWKWGKRNNNNYISLFVHLFLKELSSGQPVSVSTNVVFFTSGPDVLWFRGYDII